MAPAYYLCSQLVTLRWHGGEAIVNLEEIYSLGAVLEAEFALPAGTEVELQCGSVHYAGNVKGAEEHAFGWRIAIGFSPLNPWSPERFRPEHLLNPASIQAGKESAAES